MAKSHAQLWDLNQIKHNILIYCHSVCRLYSKVYKMFGVLLIVLAYDV